MATLKEAAQVYEPKQTKNIADLDIVDINLPIDLETKEDSDGKEFSYHFITVGDEKYRVPNTVLDDLKTMIENNPTIKYVKVLKEGEGLKTRYKVVEKKPEAGQPIEASSQQM